MKKLERRRRKFFVKQQRGQNWRILREMFGEALDQFSSSIGAATESNPVSARDAANEMPDLRSIDQHTPASNASEHLEKKPPAREDQRGKKTMASQRRPT